MTTLTTHTIDSAPTLSKALLQNTVDAFGMLPNLHGVLASSPQTLEAYQKLHELFVNSSFDADEMTVVWQTINVEHECGYCVPAHTWIANSMKVDAAITDALRNQTAMPSAKLQALHEMTLIIVRNRGHVSSDQLSSFYGLGYSEQQILEIILCLSQKIISNYTNHIAKTKVDEPFKPLVWTKNNG